MKLMCKLFGHKPETFHKDIFCKRCGKWWWYVREINRSDLDESENVFPEKWLDKHMD
ncbi:DUF1660 domain-containing protein [Lactococcus lactis subsp. lactis]|uniref:DUF1660 domain-containing protein n=1 Tax=Lactococcus lactis TaxID=1358 RepID=UPI00071E3E8D|nr:DUF1660 domain-containing protein [Lactococcus lactis]NRD17193.1 DUF1660 domain-containing protein [Lactococcus lactis subsp. lactis]